MTQEIKRYRRARFWSFSLKSNEYIGRLEFVAFNFLAVILTLVVVLILHFLLLLLDVYTQASLAQQYLVLIITSLPYQYCFLRTTVLRLTDIFPRVTYSRIIIFSLVLFISVQVFAVALFVMNGFRLYIWNPNVLEFFIMVLTLPVIVILIFIPGREKPRPE